MGIVRDGLVDYGGNRTSRFEYLFVRDAQEPGSKSPFKPSKGERDKVQTKAPHDARVPSSHDTISGEGRRISQSPPTTTGGPAPSCAELQCCGHLVAALAQAV
jgi:hypothetical protein